MKKRSSDGREPSVLVDPDAIDPNLDGMRRPGRRAETGGGSLLPWVLLFLAAIAAVTFAVLVWLPLRDEINASHLALQEANVNLANLQKQLAALQAEKNELAEARESLSREVELKEQNLQALQQAQEELAQKLSQEMQQGDVAIRRERGELVVDLVDQILFDSGAATLHPRGKKVLREVAESLQKMPEIIEVRGHTDALPIAAALQRRFPTNWELSSQRATHVVRFLQEQCGIPGERLVAAGFSQYSPAHDNSTEAGRRHNRRIEVVLLRTSPMAVAPATAPLPPPHREP